MIPRDSWIAKGIALLVAAVPLATAPASGPARAEAARPADPADPGGTFLPFLRGQEADRGLTAPPTLHVSFGGRRTAAVMDTGSTGIVVAARMIPGWQSLPSTGPAELTYSSSGRVMRGRWVVTTVTIAGRDGGAVTAGPLPVMAVTAIRCLPRARDCVPQDRPRRVAMLGVGFARQGDHQAQSTPDHNPFLHADGMESGRLRPGYVVTRHGVHVGLRPSWDGAGFRTVALARSTAFPDWAAPPACIALAGRAPPACGTVLVDTGVSRMYLTVPRNALDGTTSDGLGGPALLPGTRVDIQLGGAGGPAGGYGFVAGDGNDPLAPSGITLVEHGDRPAFVNTSLHVLNGFDYLYDAGRGLVGYRPRMLRTDAR